MTGCPRCLDPIKLFTDRVAHAVSIAGDAAIIPAFIQCPSCRSVVVYDPTPLAIEAAELEAEQAEYRAGYRAGMDNAGVWGGESEEWLRGFSDGTNDRIQEEVGFA